MNYEDDWDRNRCSNGILGKDDDRAIGMMSAFDNPREERSPLLPILGEKSGVSDDDELTIEKVNELLNELTIEEVDKLFEMCKRKQQEKKKMEQKENGKTEEIIPPVMSHEMKEIFMLSNKAINLMNELFTGLDDESKEHLKGMISKGMNAVDVMGEPFMAVYGKIKGLLVHIRRETSGGRLVQTFDIWKEGFEDEDGKEPAELLVKDVPGSDFHDAVQFWYDNTLSAKHVYGPLSVKGSGKSAKMWLWGCRLYDNEKDARRRFG